jgi:hypothetical protein
MVCSFKSEELVFFHFWEIFFNYIFGCILFHLLESNILSCFGPLMSSISIYICLIFLILCFCNTEG